MIQPYVEQLLQELELAPLPKESASNTYLLELNGSLLIQIKESERGFYLFTQLCDSSEEKKEEFYILLMTANLLGQGTSDFALGLDASEKYLTLSGNFPYEMSYQQFKAKVEDFANYIDFWKEQIKEWQKKNQQALL